MSNLFTVLTRARKNQLDVLEKQAEPGALTSSEDTSKNNEEKEVPQPPQKKQPLNQLTTPRYHDRDSAKGSEKFWERSSYSPIHC